MAKGRAPGKKNRNYPPLPLADALKVARAIEHDASGMKTSRLTLAELLDSTPTSGPFKDLVASARFYGLTTGGINADEFELTELGTSAASDDLEVAAAALKQAVMKVDPYKAFFEKFKGKRVPAAKPMQEFLVRDAGVEAESAEEAATHILSDASTAGLIRDVKGKDWVDFDALPAPPVEDEIDEADDDEPDLDDAGNDAVEDEDGVEEPTRREPRRSRPNAIFVGHGKNKKPRDQLTKILGQYGIPFKVAEDEPNRGRPIPIKVKETMEECGAAILIFSADEELFDQEGNSVWRPSENVVNELGAASIMYDSRIIIFREETVNLATNYESIGYITFEHDDLTAKANDLFRELIAFGILKVSVSDD
jgi:predicted nucleotide-binding protein